MDNNNLAQNYYVYGLGLISRIDDNNNTRYYHSDFRGSTIAMSDESESITHKYEYNDFGQVLQTIEEDFNPYRYVGKYGVAFEDDDLVFMRARYYKPSVGRFLSEDPIWAVNMYPYADNNPIGFIDASGNTPLPAGISREEVKENSLLVESGKGLYNYVANKIRGIITFPARAAAIFVDAFDSRFKPGDSMEFSSSEYRKQLRTGKIVEPIIESANSIDKRGLNVLSRAIAEVSQENNIISNSLKTFFSRQNKYSQIHEQLFKEIDPEDIILLK